jgi:hypothetical protein
MPAPCRIVGFSVEVEEIFKLLVHAWFCQVSLSMVFRQVFYAKKRPPNW